MFRQLSLCMCFVLATCIAGSSLAVDPPVIGATATASCEDPWGAEGRLATNTVDLSGLDRTTGGGYGTLHGTTYHTMWLAGHGAAVLADGNLPADGHENPNPGTVGGVQWLRIELPYIYNVESMWVWNYNQSGPEYVQQRGLKNVTVEYSTTGGSSSSEWSSLGSSQWAKADGNDNYAGVAGASFGDVDAKYIVITASDTEGNWGGDGGGADVNMYYGLSEVRILGTTQWATGPLPYDGEPTGLETGATVLVSWIAGDQADAHDIYLGTDANAVADATRSSHSGLAGYWLVDYPKEYYEIVHDAAYFRSNFFVENNYYGRPGLEGEVFPLQKDTVPQIGTQGGLAGFFEKYKHHVEDSKNTRNTFTNLRTDHGYEAIFDDFIDAVINDTAVPCDEMAGYRATYLGQLAMESIRLNKPLPVPVDKWDYFVNID